MIIRQLLPALLAIFLTACSGPDRKLLDKADSIIRENPDSAMTILNSIDRNRLKEDDLAFYALLYTQAQVESSDVWLYSDSLISIAYTKYGRDLRSDKGIRANYYLGKILFNQYSTANAETERTQDVMKHFLYVYETSKKRNDDYWSAKSALHMAALLSASYRHDAALLAQQASGYFKRAGMQKDNREALIRIASLCLNSGNLDRSYQILDSLRTQCLKNQPVDSAFLTEITPMIDQALELKKIFEEKGYNTSGQENPVEKTYREYNKGLSDQTVRNFRLFRTLLWIAVIVFLTIIAILCRMFYFRNKAQEARMASYLESFLSMKTALDRMAEERDDTISHLEYELEERERQETINNQIVRDLLTDKWRTLDILCDELFELGQSDAERKRVVRNIEKELKKVVSPQGVVEIVEAVDRHMGGLVSRLREQCPFIKETDVNFLGLIYAGFSVRAVCMFTGMEYQHFYVKRSRLMKRIHNSDAPDRELFIDRMKRK